MNTKELRNRFRFYPLSEDDDQQRAQSFVIRACHNSFCELAEKIDEACADGREKALALTSLETALAWAVKAIQRERNQSTDE